MDRYAFGPATTNYLDALLGGFLGPKDRAILRTWGAMTVAALVTTYARTVVLFMWVTQYEPTARCTCEECVAPGPIVVPPGALACLGPAANEMTYTALTIVARYEHDTVWVWEDGVMGFVPEEPEVIQATADAIEEDVRMLAEPEEAVIGPVHASKELAKAGDRSEALACQYTGRDGHARLRRDVATAEGLDRCPTGTRAALLGRLAEALDRKGS